MVRERPSPPPAPAARGEHGVLVAFMVENIVGCKWSVRLIGLMANECHRPSALLRACPGLSAKVLNERLRKLTRFGIVRRTVRGEKPPVEVEYRLTDFGRRFLRILDEVRRLQEAVDRAAGGACLAAAADAAQETRPVRRSGSRSG
jgi:DNA-binding HxlR family transcriptional regulator